MTQEEKIKIRNLYTLNKLNVSEIANKVGRDKSTVRNVLKGYNVFIDTTNYMTDKEWNCIITDYQNNMTIKELSVKYNRSTGYLINTLKRNGLYEYKTLHLNDEQWDEIKVLYCQGKNDIIFEKYPTLTISSLQSKMSKLKVKSGLKNYWAEEDIKIIKDNYFDYNIDELYLMIEKRHSKDAIETYATKELGYSKNRLWTHEEDDIIIKNYSSMNKDELQKLLPNRTIQAIQDRSNKFGLVSKYNLETYWSNDDTDYLIDNWNNKSDYEIGQILNKSPMSVKDRRNLLGLYRTNKDKQGYTTIKNMLRGQIWDWKKESIESCNYQCVLTGSKDFDIHHIIGFSDIFNEYLNLNPLRSMDVNDFTKQELEEICKSFVEFHNQYPLGVCVRSDLHVLFHIQYGKHNNTLEQWKQFTINYKNQ